MDGRHWEREGGVRREDQFTRAPDFLDEHESDHLPRWGRIGAVWHGMSGTKRVVLAASLVALSLVGGAGIFTTLDDFGREVGTQPQAHGPLGADQDPGVAPDGEIPAVDGLAPGQLLNQTSDAPSPSSAPQLPPGAG